MEKKVFILEVNSTCNHSWQGSLKWVEGHKQQAFRSMLEMLRLIDSAIDQDGGEGASVSMFPLGGDEN